VYFSQLKVRVYNAGVEYIISIKNNKE